MSVKIIPIMTEKQTAINEEMPNRYQFKVPCSLNKIEIRKQIEQLYDVRVLSVNTMSYDGKRQARYTKSGIIKGRKPAFKKAVVTIDPSQNIDLFTNI